jgi:hypothetical protein
MDIFKHRPRIPGKSIGTYERQRTRKEAAADTKMGLEESKLV